MKDELKTMTYMMANEKIVNLLFTVEQTMQFMLEYDVKPDEEVKKALIPMIETMRKWLEGVK